MHNSPEQRSQMSSSSPSTSAQGPFQTAPQSPRLFPKTILEEPSANDLSDTVRPHQHAQLPQSDAQTALYRQQAHLENYLQTLLDAQSEGLLAGLGASSPRDDRSSTGRSASRSSTSTATPSSIARSHVTWAPPEEVRVMPVRQPKPKRIGLRSARNGISRTMADLAVLKTEEAQVLELGVERREEVIAGATRISEKDAGLREHIRKIETEPASERVRGLREEEKALDVEIKETELRLYRLRAKQRVMKHEVQSLENGMQAKLSSYRNALGLAEKEAQQFVAKPLLEGERTARVKSGLWALPKERRTLEMVREYYGDETEIMKRQIEEVGKERRALEEGQEVWKDVVDVVLRMEETLRTEMKNMQEDTREAGMRRILGRLGKAKGKVERQMALAEDRGWNLLMVAIGAEVEALEEGFKVLEDALQKTRGETQEEDLLRDDPGHERDRRRDVAEKVHPEAPDGPDTNGPNTRLGRSEEEDDEPGPELLVQAEE